MRLTVSHWAFLSACLSGDAPYGASRPEPAGPVAGDLVALGLLAHPGDTAADRADRARLCAFAQSERLTMDLFQVPGGMLAAANLDVPGPSGLGRLTASGKGFQPAQAVLGCLGEAVEVASWAFRDSDRDRLRSMTEPAPASVVSAMQILGFSRDQIRDRQALNRQWDGLDVIPPAGQLAHADAWVDVRRLDGRETVACPAFLCFGGFGRAVAMDDSLNADSNGCAAGLSFEAAALRAMLEVAERDATGLWWWRGCLRNRIDRAEIGDADLDHALAAHAGETGRHCWFLDISVLPKIDVVVAVSCDAAGGRVALGFGAGLRLVDAARSAFLEMIQTELSIDAQEIRAIASPGSPVPAGDRRIVQWLAQVDLARLPFLAGSARDVERMRPRAQPADGRGDRSGIVGQPVWFADLSRPEIGVSVVKCLAPGLAHFKPRLGCKRLWTLPEQRGWTTSDRGGVCAPPFLLV